RRSNSRRAINGLPPFNRDRQPKQITDFTLCGLIGCMRVLRGPPRLSAFICSLHCRVMMYSRGGELISRELISLDAKVCASCTSLCGTLCPLGQPKKAIGHESPIGPWLPTWQTVMLVRFRNDGAVTI